MSAVGRDDADHPSLSPDERAAVRAFLQRCEVRLSTVHRTAVGLLSGAGLLVVLPVVARDAVSGILRALAVGTVDATDGFLAAAVVAMLAIPTMALWLLFADLTRFFFHANHLATTAPGGGAMFTPRFTLTSLQLPADELGTDAARRLDERRRDPRAVELLVPTNDASRRRIDRQLERYGQPTSRGSDHDELRAAGLFALAAAQPRPLLEEVAKIEHGMARHVLRLRGLILRYVKAVLATLTTAVAVYAGDAVVAGAGAGDGLDRGGTVWLAGIALLWAPAVIVSVTTPVRWIEEQMRDEGAPTSAVSDDPELTLVERAALRIAAAGWVAAVVAMVLALRSGDSSSTARLTGALTLAATVVAVAVSSRNGRLRNLRRLPT